MARPKKPRFVEGVQLEEHLHRDPRNRPGYWRYRRPNGTWKIFRAENVAEANQMAREANGARDKLPEGMRNGIDRASFAYRVEAFIAWRERHDPALPGQENWRNRRGALRSFARTFSATPVHKISRAQIAAWWDTLTHHQQGLRFTELRRFFNWLAGDGGCPQLEYNPFTLSDDRPRLYQTRKRPVARMRLTPLAFWAIYAKAGEMGMPGLQVAMGISLITALRREDVCALELEEHARGDCLRRIVGKSAAQRGQIHAARLEWDLTAQPLLAGLIRRARELSLQHFRCPYVVSHLPERKRRGSKSHACQVLPDRLTKMFAEVRDATGLFQNLPAGQPPTFHEIRALSAAMFGRAGYDVKAIQALMAHTDEDVTKLYQSGQDLPYLRIEMHIPPEILGGTF